MKQNRRLVVAISLSLVLIAGSAVVVGAVTGAGLIFGAPGADAGSDATETPTPRPAPAAPPAPASVDTFNRAAHSVDDPASIWVVVNKLRPLNPQDYEPGDLEGYVLAFVATDDRSVNATVAAEGKERRVWVNAVDDPPYCDFIMPGIAQQGDLIVAISTSGTSPAMARKMREEIEAFLTEDYALMLELAAEVRAELREKGVLVDSETWNRALDGELRQLLADGKRGEAKERLLRSLSEPVSTT